jgi:AbrB family looped-hinge helix DNA binding protein
MGISKITRNYQVSIPRDVRAALDLKVGDVVMVESKGDSLILKPIRRDVIEESFGIWRGKEEGWKTVRRIRDESERRLKRAGL